MLNGLHIRSDETGVVFHLLGCLSEFGKLGCTAIAETTDGAVALYRRTVDILDRVTGDASRKHDPGGAEEAQNLPTPGPGDREG